MRESAPLPALKPERARREPEPEPATIPEAEHTVAPEPDQAATQGGGARAAPDHALGWRPAGPVTSPPRRSAARRAAARATASPEPRGRTWRAGRTRGRRDRHRIRLDQLTAAPGGFTGNELQPGRAPVRRRVER